MPQRRLEEIVPASNCDHHSQTIRGEGDQLFAETEAEIIGIVRDPFDGKVYVSMNDGNIDVYDGTGERLDNFASPGIDGRISYAPDGQLYFLPAFGGDVQAFPLPAMLE